MRNSDVVSLPLALNDEEIDAVLLGLRFVIKRDDDDDLANAAEQVLARIEAALPRGNVKPARAGRPAGLGKSDETTHLAAIKAAIGAERKLLLHYADRKSARSERVVWPVLVDDSGMLAAWCETRADFRHFRLDRIISLTALSEHMTTRHRVLLADWRLSQDTDGGYY